MLRIRNTTLLTIVVFLAAGCLSLVSPGITPAAAETDWPGRPIQIIVGANPGGGIDTAARLMGKYLEEELGATIVVSNVAGGAGSIAARQVKDSRPDGYTMLVCHEAILTNKISNITEFDYDSFELGGIALKVYTTCLLSRKYKTFDELLDAAERDPGRVRFGTEIATNDPAIIYMIEDEFDVSIQIIDSGAVSDQIALMMGDHIDFMKAPVGLASDYIATGEFHILGFFNEERYEKYPDVPTMRELGIDFIVDKFFLCAFPPGTNQAIIDKFNNALRVVSEKPGFIADADNVDYTVEFVPLEEIAPYFEDCKVRLAEYQEIIENRF